MCGGVVDVYAGKHWNPVEVKADMIGHFLAEFSMTYKPIRHGKVGVGATRSSKFTPWRDYDASNAYLNLQYIWELCMPVWHSALQNERDTIDLRKPYTRDKHQALFVSRIPTLK